MKGDFSTVPTSSNTLLGFMDYCNKNEEFKVNVPNYTFGVALKNKNLTNNKGAPPPSDLDFPAPDDFVVINLGSNLDICQKSIGNFFAENQISSFGQNILLLQGSDSSKNPKFSLYIFDEISNKFNPQQNVETKTLGEIKQLNILDGLFPDEVIQPAISQQQI